MKNDDIDRLLQSAAQAGEDDAEWQWRDAAPSTRGRIVGGRDRRLNNRRRS